MRDVYYDTLVKLGIIKFETHLVFIAGLPKSGTTWLEQLLWNTPGLVQLNKSFIRTYPSGHSINLKHPHYVQPNMLNCAPKNLLSFLKLHLDPHPKNIHILNELGIKTVILIRDIRDMLISRYYHVLCDQNHWDYQRLIKISSQSRLLESMKSISPNDSVPVIEYYNYWINGWLKNIRLYPDFFLLIKYEDMKLDLFSVLKRTYNFYGSQLSDSSIRKIIFTQKKRHFKELERSLSENLNLIGHEHSTFRKGIVGEWRTSYNQELKDYAKTYSGQTLIDSGYEKDLNW